MIERKVALQVLLLALCVCAYQVAQAYKSPPWHAIRHQRGFAVNADPSENQSDIFQGVRRVYARVCNPAELMVAYCNFRRQCDRALPHFIDRPPFAVIRRENPTWVLIACFVPTGVAVGVINLTVVLIDMASAEEAIASPVIYSPIALGLILSYLCRGLAPPYEYKPETTGAIGFGTCFLLSGVCIYNYSFHVIEGADVLLNLAAFFQLMLSFSVALPSTIRRN